MKNFNIVGLVLAVAGAISTFSPAQAADPRCQFKAEAPDQHTVVRGDTLWGISGKFLQHPWCWPEVWGMNREEIRNPHWIYPGQIVYLDRAAGRLRLGKTGLATDQGAGSGMHLSPQVRMEGLGKDAIRSIPTQDIEPFLSHPLVVDETELASAPRIIAADEGRVIMGKDDRTYVRGNLQNGTSFQIFRPGQPLRDPETKAVIAYEAYYLGTTKLTREASGNSDVHTFKIASAKEEISVGDRLKPAPPTPLINYVPHQAETPVKARIVSVYGGVSYAGQNQVVSINRGSAHGIDLGTVLDLYRHGQTITDRTEKKGMLGFGGGTQVKLPDEQYGTLFIFRVFKNISYGLVMQVTDTVRVGDVAKSSD
ncbi:LysM peptidoglycan-binding domain-containing protein [Massilia sp. W12]|uniref:LysM peptidoglycan-binding domain-containing protein n=1 Tax=Massilia sp. W12 TaxID=3126507 RepID=UPI0030D3D355